MKKPARVAVRRPPASAARLLARYRKAIEQARVYDVAVVSPLERAPRLSARLGHAVWLKREDQQPVHSFKLRGAYNRIARLTPAQLRCGVIAASAGNHAQGVALAAHRLGFAAVIVMPGTTPAIKVEAVRALGGKVVLHGDTYDESAAHARELAQARGMTLVPPYDDPDVIAGQGTVGRELLDQATALDAVFIPVGGGGLLAGVAAYIKAVRPSVRIVGVEPDDAASMTAALAAGRRVVLPQVGLFADGVAVKQAGAEPFRIARHTVDEMVTVSVDQICAAIRDVFYDNRSVPEPAGAVAVAGLKAWAERRRGGAALNLAAIVSGSNLNFDRLRHVAERAEIGDHHETLLAVTIPETPGSFRRFLGTLGRRTVTEFNYRYSSARQAHVFVGLKLGDAPDERAAIVQRLRGEGYGVNDMTGNEMAKTHVRYMVGGRAPGLADEILLRFEFPERPGAALDFLNALHGRWNISLFHYRNHGAAYGRVLCGLQVPHGERRDCRRALDALGYEYVDETANPAYRLFLGTEGV